MARIHYWQFLTSDGGLAIDGADISITKSGLSPSTGVAGPEAVWVYYGASGTSGSSGPNQVQTQQNGYFEFFVGQEGDVDAHYLTPNDTVRLTWSKGGIVYGHVDEVNVIPQKGVTGPQGVQGYQGVQGVQGYQGFQGDFGGPQGYQGATGPQGYQGITGSQGSTGTSNISVIYNGDVTVGTGPTGYVNDFNITTGKPTFMNIQFSCGRIGNAYSELIFEWGDNGDSLKTRTFANTSTDWWVQWDPSITDMIVPIGSSVRVNVKTNIPSDMGSPLTARVLIFQFL